MPNLQAQLTVKLDVSSLVASFLGDVTTPFGSLQAIADPIAAGDLASLKAQTDGLDLSSIKTTVTAVAERATSLASSLPAGASVLGPITEWLALLETVLRNPDLGDFDVRVGDLVAKLSAIIDGQQEEGFLTALHTVALALGEAREGKVILDLIARLTAPSGVSLPQLPIADAIQALDGAVRVLGGLMMLDSVTSDVERLSSVMAARIDPRALEAHLRSLEMSLTVDGVELADAVLAVDPLDGNAVAGLALRVTSVAATLDHVREEFSAAMGLGEATLAYLDIDRVLGELDLARTLIRTGDLAPLGRICKQLAGAVAPYLREEILSGPRQGLDAIVAQAEAQVSEAAASLEAIDVAHFATPLADGIAVLISPLEHLQDVLGEVRVTYEGALGTIRQGVEALPLRAIADAIRALLEPIEEILAAIEKLVATIGSALETAATATTTTLGAIEQALDTLKANLDAFFKLAKTALEEIGIEQTLGAVEDNVRQISTALEQARMAPYFATAANAIDTAASAIDAVPFDLLPEAMKAEVDKAVQPIKEANAEAVKVEIEGMLQFTKEGDFAVLGELDKVLADLQKPYDTLIAEIRTRDPRTALADVDAKLKEIADRVRGLAPALTLQPVRQMIDEVKHAVQAIDLKAPLAPVRSAFDKVIDAVNGFRPSTLIGGAQTELADLRARLLSVTRLAEWEEAIKGIEDQARGLADRYNPALLTHQLELVLGELVGMLEALPSADAFAGLGAIVAGLLSGMGLHVYPHSFEVVSEWLRGVSGTSVLSARTGRVADAIVRTAEAVASLDFAGRTGAVALRVDRLRTAIPTLTAGLPDDTTVGVTLAGAIPRLDATATFGSLDANRARYAAALSAAQARSEAIRQAGFSEVDVRVADLGRAIAPLDPARAWMRRVLEQAGITGFELGLAGVMAAVFKVVPPARLIAIVMPLFDALKNRMEALVSAVIAPLKNGIGTFRATIDAVDLTPLLASLDSVHAAAVAQITALHPDALLGDALAAVDGLQSTLVAADPLTPILTILDTLRDTIARVLEKLSLDHLLETPLAVYDEIMATLAKLDAAALIAPLRDELGEIAHEVHDGLERTVTAFERLQAALPSGGGGSVLDVAMDVGIDVGVGF